MLYWMRSHHTHTHTHTHTHMQQNTSYGSSHTHTHTATKDILWKFWMYYMYISNVMQNKVMNLLIKLISFWGAIRCNILVRPGFSQPRGSTSVNIILNYSFPNRNPSVIGYRLQIRAHRMMWCVCVPLWVMENCASQNTTPVSIEPWLNFHRPQICCIFYKIEVEISCRIILS